MLLPLLSFPALPKDFKNVEKGRETNCNPNENVQGTLDEFDNIDGIVKPVFQIRSRHKSVKRHPEDLSHRQHNMQSSSKITPRATPK